MTLGLTAAIGMLMLAAGSAPRRFRLRAAPVR
jgi:hypothetical protein